CSPIGGPLFTLPSSLPPPPPRVIYPLSLHDALPISSARAVASSALCASRIWYPPRSRNLCMRRRTLSSSSTRNTVAASHKFLERDRKSTRLNSSHVAISYAVFCLKKKSENT